MGIFVYPHDCTDFSTTGLCGDLQPIEAYFEEEKNGISQIEMTLQYDELGKWKEAKVGRYISALVPVRVVPAIENDSYSTTIQKIRVKSGTRKVYVDKTCKKVLYIYKDLNGMYAHKELDIDPEGWLAKRYVAIGLGEIVTGTTRAYMYQDDYETIEQVQIPPALDGVESVTGTARLKPQFFIITSVEQTLEGMIVTAKHVFYELLANATTYKTENTVQGAAACRQVFDNLISADERFEIYSDCTDEQSGLDYDRVSPVQALLDPDEGICAKYGLSLIRDNYSIYALKNVGTDRGFVVEYGKNMLSVDCIENIDETYTRIIPFGKDKKGNAVYMDGQKWVDSERIHDYPAPRVLVLDCTDTASESGDMNLSQVKAELKRRAEEELANGIDKPNLEMTVDFLSLGDTEEYKQYRGLDKVYMFDRITVKDKVRGYNYTAEVVAVRHNLLTGMLESCTIGSLETASAARKIASWQVPTVDGGNIRLQSIVPGILGANAVATDNIQDNAVVAEKINAGAIEADKIQAGAVTAEKVDADAIKAKHLSADALNAVNVQLKTAHIGWAEIDELTAAIANIASGKIKNADIDFAHIKDLAADTAIITKGVGGELYISRLAVTEANMVSLSVGQLLVKGEDGGFYALSVDGSGNITTEKKQVGNGDVQNLSINAGEKLIEGSVTAATLNAKDIFADSAIIRQLIAANIDVDTLFAREATVAKLNATDISGNEYLRLSVKKAVDDIEIGGRNLLKNSKGDFRLYPANTGADGDNFASYVFPFKPTKGETYTFSADVEITNGTFDKISVYPYPSEYSMLTNVPIPANGRITHTFTVSVDTITQILAYAGIAGSTRGNGVIFRNVKIEKGNKATDWTAAPEDLESRVLNAETAITENAEQISLRARKTEVTSAIDAIQVGGRNILTKRPTSGQPASNITITDYGFIIAPVNQDTYVDITTHEDLVKGEEYTLSMECSGFGEGEEWPFYLFGEWGKTFVLKNGKVSYTFQSPGNMGKRFTMDDQIRDKMPSGTVTVKNLKLERGNKATDWTAAPEDTEERITKAEAEIAVQAGEIALKVNVGDSVETLENSAMTLNADGIEMTTTGHFRLYANDGKNSRIKLGGDNSTANFSVDETGKLGAVSGAFANGLTVGGQGVWTKGNIIISSSQPTGVHDVLWLKPLQGVEQVHHSFLNTSQGYWVHDENYNYTLTPQSSDVLTPGGSYTYSMTLQMAKGGSGKGIKSYTMQATLSTSAGSVTLTSPAFTLNDWGNAEVTLTATSATNLFAASGNVNAAISVKAPETGNTYLYVKSNTEITLTSKNTAASSAGAQTCTIHYIQ